MRLNRDGLGDVARTEDLQTITQLADDSAFLQAVGGEVVAADTLQIAEVDDGEFLLEDVGETALRQTAVKRHLAAFEAAHDRVTRDGTRTLAAAGRGLTLARAHTASNAL